MKKTKKLNLSTERIRNISIVEARERVHGGATYGTGCWEQSYGEYGCNTTFNLCTQTMNVYCNTGLC